jgi:hypothetical protein
MAKAIPEGLSDFFRRWLPPNPLLGNSAVSPKAFFFPLRPSEEEGRCSQLPQNPPVTLLGTFGHNGGMLAAAHSAVSSN